MYLATLLLCCGDLDFTSLFKIEIQHFFSLYASV